MSPIISQNELAHLHLHLHDKPRSVKGCTTHTKNAKPSPKQVAKLEPEINVFFIEWWTKKQLLKKKKKRFGQRTFIVVKCKID